MTATVLDPRYKNLEFLDSASTRKEWYNASIKNINAYLTSISFDASLETSLNDSNTSLFSDAAIEDIELNSTQKELEEYKKVKKTKEKNFEKFYNEFSNVFPRLSKAATYFLLKQATRVKDFFLM